MKQKKFKLTKDSFAKMCAEAGITPAFRETYMGREIIVGYGFVRHPEWVLRKFGVEKGQFPFGCYCTCWAIPEGERIPVAAIVPDPPVPEGVQDERAARIAITVLAARDHIDKVKKVEGMKLNA